jgi:23S rRNA (pseudouridine1915-N3)-methyltransferase
MIKVTVICLGKFKEKAYQSLEDEYLKRLRPYCNISVVELLETPYNDRSDMNRVKLKELELIKKHIPTGSTVVSLEEKGDMKSSMQFSQFMDKISEQGREITFVLGSGAGLHPQIDELSDYSLSLSRLTFPHNTARILLLEQIYRGITISMGKKYHK